MLKFIDNRERESYIYIARKNTEHTYNVPETLSSSEEYQMKRQSGFSSWR